MGNQDEDIIASKVKIDKENVGLDLTKDCRGRLAEVVEKARLGLESKVAELKKVDSERGLFALSKSIKEDKGRERRRCLQVQRKVH